MDGVVGGDQFYKLINVTDYSDVKYIRNVEFVQFQAHNQPMGFS